MHIFIVYNYLTLCKTLKYINDKFEKENAVIVYTDAVVPCPEKIVCDYNVVYVSDKKKKCKNSLEKMQLDISNAKRFSKAVCNIIKKCGQKVSIYIFKDNTLKETVTLGNVFKKFKHKVELILIEEGLAIYQTNRTTTSKKELKKLIYALNGVSTYSLEGLPHGHHENISRVIVRYPEQVKEKFENIGIPVEKEIEIFDGELCRYFVNAILGDEPDIGEFDYVFLTMPMDVVIRTSDWKEKYGEFLNKFLGVMSSKGTVLIKCHPRDSFDYLPYLSDKVAVCTPEQNKIPFECLYSYLKMPQMITAYSSAVTGFYPEKPSIFLYKLFNVKSLSFVTEEFLKSNNIIDCDSFEMLNDIL